LVSGDRRSLVVTWKRHAAGRPTPVTLRFEIWKVETKTMTAPAQRATLVLEHASARDDAEEQEEEGAEPWSVVAYLIFDSGLRKRATLCRLPHL
jgi:hypothetical protein